MTRAERNREIAEIERARRRLWPVLIITAIAAAMLATGCLVAIETAARWAAN